MKKERKNYKGSSLKNETLKMVTMLALTIVVILFVFEVWFGQACEWKLVVLGAVSLIWIILFILANCLCKQKNNKIKKTNKNESKVVELKSSKFKMYSLK